MKRVIKAASYQAGDLVTVNFGLRNAKDDIKKCVIINTSKGIATKGNPASNEYRVQIIGEPNQATVDEAMIVNSSEVEAACKSKKKKSCNSADKPCNCGQPDCPICSPLEIQSADAIKASTSWGDFDKFEDVIDKYMSPKGEGNTMASQIVTAVNKLIYKCYNDGDVFDNTNPNLPGWANDLSSYANWLREYLPDHAENILDDVYECESDEDYKDLLYNLARYTLNEKFLSAYADKPTQGTIYDCSGPYEFTDRDEDEYEEDDYEEEDEYEEEYDD